MTDGGMFGIISRATAATGDQHDDDELERLRAAVRLCVAHLRSRSANQMGRDEVAGLLERAVGKG